MSEVSGSPAPPGTKIGDGSSSTQQQTQQMTGQAQEKAQQAMGNARSALREQLDQRSNQAGEKITGTAQDLRSVGDELRTQGKETPAKIADMAAERTEQVGSYLSGAD